MVLAMAMDMLIKTFILFSVPQAYQLAKSNIGLSSLSDSGWSLPTPWMSPEGAGVSGPRCPGWPACWGHWAAHSLLVLGV